MGRQALFAANSGLLARKATQWRVQVRAVTDRMQLCRPSLANVCIGLLPPGLRRCGCAAKCLCRHPLRAIGIGFQSLPAQTALHTPLQSGATQWRRTRLRSRWWAAAGKTPARNLRIPALPKVLRTFRFRLVGLPQVVQPKEQDAQCNCPPAITANRGGYAGELL